MFEISNARVEFGTVIANLYLKTAQTIDTSNSRCNAVLDCQFKLA
ncbi:hypothetical protein [Photobacterium angustum]|nr:hypothetical protein [Photobacterium angustum]